MLNETASSRDDRPYVRSPLIEEAPEDRLGATLRQMVDEVMDVESMVVGPETQTPEGEVPRMMLAMGNQLSARFVGKLKLDSEVAYEQLDQQFKTLNHLPLFRIENGKHVIVALEGRVAPEPRPWWPNLLLLIATFFSVLIVGTNLAIQTVKMENWLLGLALQANFWSELWRGLPYALSILLILGAHELGHYFAARRHKLAVTLPYFIPLPVFSLFGTLGAFIQLREPIRNRKALLDVGAAGPLAGLVFAIPLLFIGLASAQTGPVTPGGLYEGDSLLYAFAKIVTFGEFLPNGERDVVINSSQLAWAGWTGLLVSALNLIPLGQLDGGHIIYALIGERARWLYYPLLAIMMGLVLVTNIWLLWVFLLLLFGRVYATPLDMITPLDNKRRGVAVAALVIFVLIFVPTPLSSSGEPAAPRAPCSSAQLDTGQPLASIFSIGTGS